MEMFLYTVTVYLQPCTYRFIHYIYYTIYMGTTYWVYHAGYYFAFRLPFGRDVFFSLRQLLAPVRTYDIETLPIYMYVVLSGELPGLSYTVEPPNKGHLGTRASVLYSVVSFIRRLEMY